VPTWQELFDRAADRGVDADEVADAIVRLRSEAKDDE